LAQFIISQDGSRKEFFFSNNKENNNKSNFIKIANTIKKEISNNIINYSIENACTRHE